MGKWKNIVYRSKERETNRAHWGALVLFEANLGQSTDVL